MLTLKNKSNWKLILIVVTLAIIVVGSIFIQKRFNDLKEKTTIGYVNESENIIDSEESSPNLFQSKLVTVEKTTIDNETKFLFLNPKSEKIAEINENNSSFTLLNIYQSWYDDSISVASSKIALNKAIEYPSGIFYFFATDPRYCGTGGCPWFFFKYDSINQEILNIKNDNVLDIKKYQLSPNGKNLAIESYWSGGAGWSGRDSIDIFSFEKFEFKNIDLSILTESFFLREDEAISFLDTDFFGWIDDDCFSICAFTGVYKYCLSNSELELITKDNLEYGCITACLAKGTQIAMSDGNYKNIENIKEEDLVKTFNFEINDFKFSKVIKIIKRKDPIIEINNTLRAAPDEPIYLFNGTIKKAKEIIIGEIIFGENKNGIKVESVTYSADKIDTYDLVLEDSNNFFADGYLVLTPE
jgi:hypothetical protein